MDRSRFLLVRSLWLLAGAIAVHEAEEWNVADWTARNFTNHTGVTNEAMWPGLIVITALFAAWIFLATRLVSPSAISLIALPAVAVVAVGNAVQHITWLFLFSEYDPGVVSAVLLVIPASFYVIWCMIRVRRVLLLPLAACAVLWAAAAYQIVAAGRVMQPFQLIVQHLCISFAKVIGLM